MTTPISRLVSALAPEGPLGCEVAETSPALRCSDFSLEIRTAIAFVENGQFENLMAHLQAQRAYRSLSGFVEHIAAPFMEAVGEAWAGGKLAVYQEHLCTDIMVRMLSAELTRCRQTEGGTRILFATPESEQHALGNLMARCVLTDQGANCMGLGPQMPTEEIVQAAMAWKAEIVALSFSFSYPAEKVLPILERLQELLPDSMNIWAGGAGVRAFKTQVGPRIRVFSDLATPVQVLRQDRPAVDYLAFS